jgi:hypothetical protein
MSTFNTIHLFGFGDTQIIKEDLNKSVKASELTTQTAFVDAIKALKPEDVVLTDYHVIHIFEGGSVRYLGQPTEVKTDVTTFTLNWEDVPTALLDTLVTEIEAKLAEETPAE